MLSVAKLSRLFRYKMGPGNSGVKFMDPARAPTATSLAIQHHKIGICIISTFYATDPIHV